jgi:hypothetical protein
MKDIAHPEASGELPSYEKPWRKKYVSMCRGSTDLGGG